MKPLLRRSVTVFASAAVVTLLLSGGYPLGAQEGKTTKSQTPRAKQADKVEAPSAMIRRQGQGHRPRRTPGSDPPGSPRLRQARADRPAERVALQGPGEVLSPDPGPGEAGRCTAGQARDGIRGRAHPRPEEAAGGAGAAKEGGIRGPQGGRGQGPGEGGRVTAARVPGGGIAAGQGGGMRRSIGMAMNRMIPLLALVLAAICSSVDRRRSRAEGALLGPGLLHHLHADADLRPGGLAAGRGRHPRRPRRILAQWQVRTVPSSSPPSRNRDRLRRAL